MASEIEIKEAISRFPSGTRVVIQSSGILYRVGWKYRGVFYIPPEQNVSFEEAINLAIANLWKKFPEAHSYEDLV